MERERESLPRREGGYKRWLSDLLVSMEGQNCLQVVLA